MEKPKSSRIDEEGEKTDEEHGNQDALRKFQIQMSTGEKHRSENWD